MHSAVERLKASCRCPSRAAPQSARLMSFFPVSSRIQRWIIPEGGEPNIDPKHNSLFGSLRGFRHVCLLCKPASSNMKSQTTTASFCWFGESPISDSSTGICVKTRTRSSSVTASRLKVSSKTLTVHGNPRQDLKFYTPGGYPKVQAFSQEYLRNGIVQQQHLYEAWQPGDFFQMLLQAVNIPKWRLFQVDGLDLLTHA